jgi:hypothetical protein
MDAAELKAKISAMALRFQFSLMLTVVTAFGIVVNRLAHEIPIDAIGFRYAFACFASYLFFFIVVRVWIWFVLPADHDEESGDSGRSYHSSGSGSSWWPNSISSGDGGGSSGKWSGEGGAFAGAGASGDYGDSASPGVLPFPIDLGTGGGSGGGGGKSGGGKGDGLAILLVIILVVALIAAAVYFVIIGPKILIEAAMQYAYSHGLVRGFPEEIERENWAFTLLSKTYLAFAALLVVFAGVGFYANSVCPRATHIMDLSKEICTVHSR